MYAVIKSDNFTQRDKKRVKMCRLYMGVIMLSGITKTSGKWLSNGAFFGKYT